MRTTAGLRILRDCPGATVYSRDTGEPVGQVIHEGGDIWRVVALCGVVEAADAYPYCWTCMTESYGDALAMLLGHLRLCEHRQVAA